MFVALNGTGGADGSGMARSGHSWRGERRPGRPKGERKQGGGFGIKTAEGSGSPTENRCGRDGEGERGEEWVVVGGARRVGTWIPFFGFHRCCVYQSLTTAIMIKIVF